jgi:CO/xanthine dehydrogenase Mo-binding subunit
MRTVRTGARDELALVGRVDGFSKVNGAAKYAADVHLPGALYGSLVRSPYSHARIVRIDTSEAAAVPGVRAIITGADLSKRLLGRSVRDIPVLAYPIVRYVGERVAAVAAETQDIADHAASLVQVEYENLPALLDASRALDPDAPVVHEAPSSYVGAVVSDADHPNLQSCRIWAGGEDVEAALAASARTFSHTFDVNMRHQGYLETHSCIARTNGDAIEVWVPHKGPYQLRRVLAEWLDVPPSLVRIQPMLVGGDFGGKGAPMDVPICILLARKTGRPVRMRSRYSEELTSANPRHPGRVTVRLGVDERNRITALDVHAVLDGGAYAGYKPQPHVNLNGLGLAGTSYRIPALRVESSIVYTHTVPKSHMRSPGSPQTVFTVESLLVMAARELGVDPIAFRSENLLEDGEHGPLGEHWTEVRVRATLDAAMRTLASLPPQSAEVQWATGTGIAIYSRDAHFGRTEVALEPQPDGSLLIAVPFTDQGAGQHTMAQRVIERSLGLPAAILHVEQATLNEFEFDSGCSSARVTMDATIALSGAAQELERRLREEFELPEQPTEADWQRSMAAFAEATGLGQVRMRAYHTGGPTGRDHLPHMPHLLSSCVQIARVRVDRRTGTVVVDDLVTAADVAEILNPGSHMAQIVGGIVMGYGEAMVEDLVMEDGRVVTANLDDYRLPSTRDVPRLWTTLVEGGRGFGDLNVKPIGELTNVAVSAAVANAVADAVGVRLNTLPVTPERVFAGLQAMRAG